MPRILFSRHVTAKKGTFPRKERALGCIIGPMIIRRASRPDWVQIAKLAKECELNYSGMESDKFWVAEEDGRVFGIVALKSHPECRELCALGVDPKRRGLGIGKRLALELIGGVRGDVYLATIIPGFFERLGFVKPPDVPPSMVKDADWCAGCRRDLCTVMVRRQP